MGILLPSLLISCLFNFLLFLLHSLALGKSNQPPAVPDEGALLIYCKNNLFS